MEMTTEQRRAACRRYYWANVEKQRQRTLANYHKWKKDPAKKKKMVEANRRAKARERYGVENREEILKRFDFKCVNCGAKKNLHIHHIDNKGRKVGVKVPNNNGGNLIVLCVVCHLQYHSHGKQVKI